MIRRLWRWLTADTTSQHREMEEADLCWPGWWIDRARLDAQARHQVSVLDLGKQLGVYPRRTMIDERGRLTIPVSPEDVAAREELRQALRRQHT